MERRNQNLTIGIIAAALLLCCCALVVFGGLAGYMLVKPQTSTTSQDGGGSVIVVTGVVTPVGEQTAVTPTPKLPAALRETRTPSRQNTPTVPATPGASSETATATPPAGSPTVAGVASTEQLLAAVEMPERDLRALAERFKPHLGEIPAVVNASAPNYKIGDKARFWISDTDTNEHKQIVAILRYVTDHVYMWVEDGVQLNQTALQRSADRFEEQTYPTGREFFGSEWTPGVDNDVHLSILHARGLGSSIAGYYSSADEYSRLINPYSNEKEMFYVSADADNSKPNTSRYDGTLAHEFQHMIHWANDPNEDTWVNEGMSMLAERLNSFDVGGADVVYSRKPDTQLTTWTDISEGNTEHYGASYLFMDYFLNRFGEDLTKAVVASTANGAAGFNGALADAGFPERFDDIFADWVIANYLDLPDAEPKGHFGYPDIDPFTPALAETYRSYPVSAAAQVSQYGVDYIRLKGRGVQNIEFTGQREVGLVATQPQGEHFWWSNRGDDSDATLTRVFDLSNVTAATLTFSTWYDIEDGFDYAYLAASTDGGESWQLLRGTYSTDENPVGNAFGPGWTGASGSATTTGEQPAWVDEHVDLTPFAGKQILLRFEYVTDDALNLPGFLVDDLVIPELGYRDGGEAGTGGWTSAGWVLTNNELTQDWLVQLVEIKGKNITVQRMVVDAAGRGRLTTSDLGKLDDAILVISALAPATTEPATYSYSIKPQ